MSGFSYYASASSLSPKFYQTLLDRCWRRSGKLIYRPDQKRSCCPHYTIRLDSHDFKPSRNQRQVVNKFNDYVLGEKYIKEAARLHPRSKEETKRRKNEFVLTERVHEAEYNRVKTPPEPAHKLEVTLEYDNFTEEKYEVYNNYQKNVHGDAPEDRTKRGFTRFLSSAQSVSQITQPASSCSLSPALYIGPHLWQSATKPALYPSLIHTRAPSVNSSWFAPWLTR